jgi:hypothetical protein
LLVEEQRTNLTLYSEQFDNAAWSVKSNSSITANTIISPDGTLSADKLVENTASGQHWVGGNTGATITSGVAYTLSVYAKQAERGYFQMYGDAGGGRLTVGAVFNLTNGTVYSTASGAIASITSVDNGWYRCSVTATASSTGSSYLYIGLRQNSAPATDSYTGDGYSGVYIWGAQLEAGSFPTSYIKTEASQVTRSADSASMTGANFSDWYNPSQGSFYAEASWISRSQTNQAVIGLDTAVNGGNWFGVGYGAGGPANAISAYGQNGIFIQNSSSVTLDNTFYKFAISLKTNDVALTTNSSSITTDTSGYIVSVNRFRIGTYLYGSMSGHIKKISYYPTRLSNENLQALTS